MSREQAIVTVLDAVTFSEQDGFSLPPTLEDQKLARQIVDALGVGKPDSELTAPTEDQLRLARAALDPLTDVQRRAVYAVVAYETVRELEGDLDRLSKAVKDAVQRAQIDWSDAESGLPMVGVDLNDWTRIVCIATDDDEPGPVQLSGGRDG